MFRKKNARITLGLLEDILDDVRWTFQNSEAPAYLKRRVRKLPIVFGIVNRPYSDICGNAIAIGRYAKKEPIKHRLKLKLRTHPTVTIDGDYYFLVIEINRGALKRITRRGLRYLVAHEYAHILQIVVDEEVSNQSSYSTPEDHNKRWQRFCKWMGGDVSEYIQRFWI
jgi:hypothetical protein